MSYAIFRSEPIQTLSDLAQIGSHNKREKKAYQSNPDIKINLSKNNIDIVTCPSRYVEQFYNITKEYKKEHDIRMETTRKERQKSFRDMVNTAKSVVADELLFTSDKMFFKDLNKKDIIKWANACMEFVYNDLGYTNNQVLHATVHMDEKTPHLHCVVVPLVYKFDKRTKTNRYCISKKQYIKDKIHLSELQDKYHQRMVKAGFNLQRGVKNSDNEHLTMKEFKKMTKKQDKRLEQREYRLTNIYNSLDENLKSKKYKVIGNKIQVDKDTLKDIEKFMDQAKLIIEETPKTQSLYRELKKQAETYNNIEKEKKNIQDELDILKYQNEQLKKENTSLYSLLKHILETLKFMFRIILQLGTDQEKDILTKEIMSYYDQDLYTENDLYNIGKETSKEDELNNYTNSYYEKNEEHNINL